MKIIANFLLFFLLFNCCSSNKRDFELCSGKKHPYYHPNLEYSGGFHEIKKHFYDNYKDIGVPNDTGIVKIRFNVNCKGESGDFYTETYNLDYKGITIDEKVTKQLLDLTKTLNDWIPAYNEDGNSINSHKFFAFKILDGKLIDILPK